MQANTIVSYSGGTLRNQIGSQTLASTVETEFKLNTDAGANTNIAILTMPQQGAIAGSFNPQDPTVNQAIMGGNYGAQYGRPLGSQGSGFNSNSFDGGVPFTIRVVGVATPASNGANSLNIILYQGTSKSGTAICSTAAVPQATTTTAKSFILETECFWDSTSQVINGQFWFSLPGTSGTVYTTWAKNTNAPSSIAVANLTFVASATWGNAAGGVVAVREFSVQDS